MLFSVPGGISSFPWSATIAVLSSLTNQNYFYTDFKRNMNVWESIALLVALQNFKKLYFDHSL